jgi:hypothetical protein
MVNEATAMRKTARRGRARLTSTVQGTSERSEQ